MAEPWKNRACRLAHFLLLLFVFLLPGVVSSTDYDYTFTLPPGQRECFYQEVKKETNFEVEYQVIDGGDLDVTFVLRSPKGVPLVTELRKSEGIHSIDAKEDGDYMFCFDNTFSRISEKMIFLTFCWTLTQITRMMIGWTSSVLKKSWISNWRT
ncbi:Transmembrane emp24 domain-containing protein 5 [Branchiostoma belcheri]|nr:Transmembrane emp24 domain-containing protein 5 [Branchiostoma belcheri]